ncbi:hypothetical protein BU24DRAFT_42130 [Aaosphaeria arxii CBS 175.79]|uniref:Uncharacterized protein n=1 Tax=Aaosphaeria arxii CBS 175.79 TaxID=1450172 RepID=A0A6A5YB90_9PLEO|nr:uncharacterized protein BU24DRAFT_42130 [Aaosphaeria arxii CBS 175.79]KAF2022297.1 hypothetical protein BU24DRAFT_42130 [Aaosphaeria arxii CBS 175.79]
MQLLHVPLSSHPITAIIYTLTLPLLASSVTSPQSSWTNYLLDQLPPTPSHEYYSQSFVDVLVLSVYSRSTTRESGTFVTKSVHIVPHPQPLGVDVLVGLLDLVH